MRDGDRLELDDDGRALDAPDADRVVESAQESPSRAGRVLDAVLSGGSGSSTTARLLAGAGLAGVLAVALVISTRTSAPAPSSADVLGVSAHEESRAQASAVPRILATYAVRGRPGSAQTWIVGVRGDIVAQAVETRSRGGTQSFLVDPRCDRLLAPEGDPSYQLLLATGLGPGAPTTTVTGFEGADALTSAAVRACWGSTASRGLRPVSVAARPGAGPWTALDVVLRNGTAVAMSITAVDVANVDTLSMADSRVVEPGAEATVRVRLPIARCTSGMPSPSRTVLTWSVGPPDDAPTAFAATTLTPAQSAIIAAAARARCATAPTVSVELLAASSARDARSGDERGLSVALRLRVTTDAQTVVLLGADPRGLTSDARPVFTGTTVAPGARPRAAELVWHTRCDPSRVDVTLPVSTTVDGLTYAWSVPLTGASLEAVRTAACR
jgi:hypothetical protein